MKRLLITSGEPAGIGIELCLNIQPKYYQQQQLIVLADAQLLPQSHFVATINKLAEIDDKPGLYLWHLPLHDVVQPGVLNAQNSAYVIKQLVAAATACQQGEAHAIVTAPVHKGILNQQFSHFKTDLEQQFNCTLPHFFLGHTEFLQHLANVDHVVMMLASDRLKTALVTTHIPLQVVAKQLSQQRIETTIALVYKALDSDFKTELIDAKQGVHLAVLALNPHAGESGHLGREEIELIQPALAAVSQSANKRLRLTGPISADTAFTLDKLQQFDAYIGMYHDQVLPVFKHISFSQSANITLGLPYVRTSVDHGSALDIAGQNMADAGSFNYAIAKAISLLKKSH